MYAKVKVGATKDGTLMAWDSESWGTGGPQEAGGAIPLRFRIPNRREAYADSDQYGAGSRLARAESSSDGWFPWRAGRSGRQAEHGPAGFLLKNIRIWWLRNRAKPTGRIGQSRRTDGLEEANGIRAAKSRRPLKRGLGFDAHLGRPRTSQQLPVTIHPDGSVEISLGSQDLGTGTRTVIAIVAAETLGLPLEGVTVNIGDKKYPPSGASGGSTTIGGVSTSTRRATTERLNQLLAKVAPSLGAKADQLEALGGNIQVTGDPSKTISWKQACAKLGARRSVTGNKLRGT